MQASKRAIFAVLDEEAVLSIEAVAVIIAWIAVEVVGADDDIGTIFNQKIVSISHPESIAGKDNASTIF